MREKRMRIFRFDLPGGRDVDVAAHSVQEALALLCRFDYFDGVDDTEEMSWYVREDDDKFSVRLDDASDSKTDGAHWDPVKRLLTASAKWWAEAQEEPCVVGDSEA